MEATYFNWKSKYVGMEAADIRTLKERAEENARLKRMYTDLVWENTALNQRCPDRDHEVIAVLLGLAERYPERGFGKLFKLIRRRGLVWIHKRVWRVYGALKLNMRRKGRKRLPNRINASWSADFMPDALWDGWRFRTFNVVDDFSREGLAFDKGFYGHPECIFLS